MDNKFFIIKLKDEVKELNIFKGFLERSRNPEEKDAYYNLVSGSSAADNNIFDLQMEKDKEYRCALLGYTNKEITCLYWAKCYKHDDGIYRFIPCRLLYKITDKKIIETLLKENEYKAVDRLYDVTAMWRLYKNLDVQC